MKSSMGIQARAVDKKGFTPDFKNVNHNDPGLAYVLVDKKTGRLMVQAGDDREFVNLKTHPLGALVLFPGGSYADGDCLGGKLFAEGLIGKSGTALLESVCIVDRDNVGAAMDLIFFHAEPAEAGTTITDNSALVLADLDAPKITGWLKVASTDYVQVDTVTKVAQKVFPVPLRSTAADGSIYVAIIARQAATYVNNLLKNVNVGLFVKQT